MDDMGVYVILYAYVWERDGKWMKEDDQPQKHFTFYFQYRYSACSRKLSATISSVLNLLVISNNFFFIECVKFKLCEQLFAISRKKSIRTDICALVTSHPRNFRSLRVGFGL